MKRSYQLAVAVAAFLSAPAWSQTKIGDNPSAINANAILELESANKGFLLPRLALTATNLPAPLSAHVAGMTVFNTATAGSGATAVSPGVYYNDGTKWVLLGDLSSVLTFYNGDGTVNSNRTVTMGANNLYFNTSGNVAIGGNTANANAVLELISNNKGLLIPRVALSSTTNFSPLTAHVPGMMVYNTVSSGSGTTAVTPGFYFNNGTKWIRIDEQGPTVYTGDGTISSTRTINMGGNNLYFNNGGTVGIGSTTTNNNALLDLTATNKGLLIPRLSLTSTTSFGPLSSHVAGMLVYNTATNLDVTPGFYYNDGTKWVRVADQASINTFYNSDGTINTNRTVNLGTNDLHFNTTGNTVIGANTANSNAILELVSNNKGLLLPRLSLTSTSSFGPLTAHVAGMIVYNTATINDVKPGYYFNNGTGWIRIDGTNIYNSDGTVNANRTVNLGGNYLQFNNGNVGIGTTTVNGDAILELNSTNKGLLIPRLSLTSTSSAGPLSTHVAGMIVYNTATINDVKPGYYFDNGTSWIRIDGSNVYNTDGNITNNRTINMGGNNLYFTGGGKFAINNNNPTSIFDVNGSISFPLRTVSSGTSTALDSSDFALQITNAITGPYTVTLPAGSTAVDRMYTIVNQSNTAKTVSTYYDMFNNPQTIIPANSSINIQANAAGNWIQTGGTGNYTSGALFASYEQMGNNSILVDQGATRTIIDAPVTVNLDRPSTLILTGTGFGIPNNVTTADSTVQGVLRLEVDGAVVSEAFTSSYTSHGSKRIPNPTTMVKKITLAAGSHTINLRASGWLGNMDYNVNATTLLSIPGTASNAMDSEALKSRLLIQVYNQ